MLVYPLAFTLAYYAPHSLALPAWGSTCHVGKSISWTSCGIFGYNDTLDAVKPQCGYFTVPADYKNCGAGSVNLAVVRRPATVKPKLGTLFVNPGDVVKIFLPQFEADHQNAQVGPGALGLNTF
jgi:hypothetical protein